MLYIFDMLDVLDMVYIPMPPVLYINFARANCTVHTALYICTVHIFRLMLINPHL
jgi:hypothetical protein